MPSLSRVRLFGLLAVVTLTAALPLAGAAAGPVGEEERDAARGAAGEGRAGSVRDAVLSTPEDAAKADRKSSPRLTGSGLPADARCGPELATPDGTEAQTCVLTQEGRTWGRSYYRNGTGGRVDAVLSLLAPDGRTVQVRCAVDAEDEPGACETPRERTVGEPGAYTAVAEYAAAGASGPLLLRSGSNSA